jgi:hypothetical protein
MVPSAISSKLAVVLKFPLRQLSDGSAVKVVPPFLMEINTGRARLQVPEMVSEVVTNDDPGSDGQLRLMLDSASERPEVEEKNRFKPEAGLACMHAARLIDINKGSEAPVMGP